jgi:hypothetical protein
MWHTHRRRDEKYVQNVSQKNVLPLSTVRPAAWSLYRLLYLVPRCVDGMDQYVPDLKELNLLQTMYNVLTSGGSTDVPTQKLKT